MKLLLTLALLIILAPLTLAQWSATSDMDLFSESIACVDDISAGFINPAGLAFGPQMALRYIHATTDSTMKGDDGFMLLSRGNMLSVQWLKNGNGIFRRKFLFAGGKLMFPKFYWGISFAYFNGSSYYDKKKIWKTGIISTPMPNVMLGFVVDNLNAPKFENHRAERIYIAGAAYRLKMADAKLSADAWMNEKNQIDDVEARFRMEFTVKKQFKFVAHYVTEGLFQVGIAYSFAHLEIGGGVSYSEYEVLNGNFYYNQLPIALSR